MPKTSVSGRTQAPRPLPPKVVYAWLDASTPAVDLTRRLRAAGLELRADTAGEWFLVVKEPRQ